MGRSSIRLPSELLQWVDGRDIMSLVARCREAGMTADWRPVEPLEYGERGAVLQVRADDDMRRYLRSLRPTMNAGVRACIEAIMAAERGELLTPERIRAAAGGWP